MRTLILAAALALSAPAAIAQETAQPAAVAPSEPHLAAARDLITAMLVDTGAIDIALDQSIQLLLPQLRTQITSGALYQSLSQARRDALMAFTENDLGRIMREEAAAAMPAALDAATTRFAGLFSEQELRDAAAFMRQPAARATFLHGVTQGVYQSSGQTPPPAPALSADDLAAAAAFSATPSGRALDARASEVSAVLVETLGAAFNDARPRLQQRLLAGMCDALGDECPPALRAQAGGT